MFGRSRVALVFALPVMIAMLPIKSHAAFALTYNAPPLSNSIDAKTISFIDSAVSSMDIAIYSIDHSGIVNAIIRAKNRGVAVRMVVETDNWNIVCDQLVAAGIPVVKDNAGGGGQGLMHDKYIIRDGNAVLTGTYNFTNTQTTADKNSIIIITTATGLAGIYKTDFNKMFVNKQFGTAKSATTPNSVKVGTVTVEVYFSPHGDVRTHIVNAINTCTSNLYFNCFTYTDQGIADAMIARKNLGYIVKGTFDRWQADSAYSKDEYLLAAGVLIHRDNYSGLLHDKLIAIDAGTTNDPIGIIGSFNFTGSADTNNDENMLIIHNSTVANSIKGACVNVYNNQSN